MTNFFEIGTGFSSWCLCFCKIENSGEVTNRNQSRSKTPPDLRVTTCGSEQKKFRNAVRQRDFPASSNTTVLIPNIMATVKKGLNSLGDSGFLVKAQAIVDSMTGNANFTTPVPTLLSVNGAITAYSGKLTDATATRSKLDVAAKNAARLTLFSLLNQLGDYVSLTAAGDALKIISSGFEVKRSPVPVLELDTPSDTKAVPTETAGVVKVSHRGVVHALMYEYQLNTVDVNDETKWLTRLVKKEKIVSITGLTTGTVAWVRVIAHGARVQSSPGDPARSIVP